MKHMVCFFDISTITIIVIIAINCYRKTIINNGENSLSLYMNMKYLNLIYNNVRERNNNLCLILAIIIVIIVKTFIGMSFQ